MDPAFTPPPPGPAALTPFQMYVADNELSEEVATDLYDVLTTTRVVLLLDDSGSMGTRIAPPTGTGFTNTGAGTTRWSELDKVAATVVEMVNATTGGGVDMHFLNRPAVMDVRSRVQMQPAFVQGPGGGTPLLRAIRSLGEAYSGDLSAGGRVLFLVITDGEPSDGSPSDLFRVLDTTLRRYLPHLFVSFAECNDNEEEMAYLDGWDRRLPNFDNTDDFGMEAQRVKAAQRSKGLRQRFSYADYIVKIILGSILPKYFNMDQPTVCCAIL